MNSTTAAATASGKPDGRQIMPALRRTGALVRARPPSPLVLPSLPPRRLRRTPGRRYRGHRRPGRAAGNHPRTQPRRMRDPSAGLPPGLPRSPQRPHHPRRQRTTGHRSPHRHPHRPGTTRAHPHRRRHLVTSDAARRAADEQPSGWGTPTMDTRTGARTASKQAHFHPVLTAVYRSLKIGLDGTEGEQNGGQR